MVSVDWQEYWWSSVTGPREFVLSTITALKLKKSAILHVPQDFPWRRELRRSVRNSLESIPGLEDLIVDVIDIEDEKAGAIDPGRLLLDKYALREDRTKFREGGKESIQDYLLRKNVMGNRLVWIKGFGKDSSQKWVDFCEKWDSTSTADGILIIEAKEQPHITHNKRVELICYEECVSEYDVQLFNSLVIDEDSQNKLNTTWKKYAAAITTHLCGTDAEVAHSFIEQHDFKRDDPFETIGRIAESGSFENRGSGKHVLALYRSGAMDELHKNIWAGQIEVLFPLIEKQRLEIVDSYRTQIEEEIEKGISQFDTKVEKPEDVELGTLVYLMAAKRLSIPKYDIQNKIHTLRDCRNSLAHRSICSLDKVSALLDY